MLSNRTQLIRSSSDWALMVAEVANDNLNNSRNSLSLKGNAAVVTLLPFPRSYDPYRA